MGRVTAAIDLPFPADSCSASPRASRTCRAGCPRSWRRSCSTRRSREGSRIRLRLGPGDGQRGDHRDRASSCREPERARDRRDRRAARRHGPDDARRRRGRRRRGSSLELEISTPPFLGFIAKEAERRINAELPASLERFRALLEAEPA